MAVVKNLMVRAGADFSELQKELAKAQKTLKTAGAEMSKLGTTLTLGLTAPIVAAGAAAFKLASDFDESSNKVQVAFKDWSGYVMDWASDSLKAFGIAGGTALDMAALFGDMGTSMGLSTEQAAKMSTSLVGLAGDLASFKNIGVDQAQDALKGIFTGEGEALKSLGVVMLDSTLKAYALATGQKKSYDEMTQAEKVALRYSYVMSTTQNAQGDFARTSGGAANQMRIFTESLKELGAAFGTQIVPVITPLITKLNETVQWFGSLDDNTKKNILTAALFVAAIGPVVSILGALSTGIGLVVAAYGTYTKAMAAGKGIKAALTAAIGPANLVLIAILALAAAAYLIITNWEPISKFFTDLWTNVTKVFTETWNNIDNFFTKTIPEIVNKIPQFFMELPGKILYALGFVIGSFVRWNLDMINWISQNGPKIIEAIGKFFWELPGNIFKAIIGAIDSFTNWQVSLIEWIGENTPKIIQSLMNFFWELPGKMLEIGGYIVKGLWDGIVGASKWLFEQVGKFVQGIKDGFTNKDALDINSPSGFGEWVGEMIPAGIAKGITNGTALTTEAASALTNVLKAKFDLWNATIGKTASESQKLSKELEYENAQLTIVNAQVETAQTAYENMLATKGELAEETQNLYAELLKELKAQADLQSQIEETTKAMKTQSKIWASGSAGSASYNSKTGNYIVVGNNGKVTTIGSGGISSGSGLASGTPGWMSTGGSYVQSFDVGTPYVPQDMLAMVHKGEKITPAKYNNALDGGGITVNVYGSVGVDDIGEKIVQTLRRKGVKFA